ncbi:pigl [Symbiodinium pilosum]|uniref:N-acetylglucosaminylphosphatidylinositol deacetylase n=1 Tax=Symbiodinium pilosum TaxID=2952 RepID=A0A812VI14_SYMPI|nr:pigl [Symbiodinium pilosum]
MFFWPVLSQLHASGVSLSVLCLSTGNFDGLGHIRQDEMLRSCDRIGVRGEALGVLDVAELQDGWQEWSADIVAAKVIDFLAKRGAHAVLTFDNKGVSGHPNHVSTSAGVQRALELSRRDSQLPHFDLFLLKSVGIHEKFLGPLSLLLGQESSSDAAAVSCSPLACLAALAVHWSQLVWYRVLFTIFSRYAYANTFVKFVPPERSQAQDVGEQCAKDD